MRFVDAGFKASAQLLILEGQGPAVGVVDDGQLVEAEELVRDGDVAQGMANVTTRIAMDDDL